MAKTNTLHLLWLYSSTCEDKVRLFYAIKCNKFYCNLTFYKLNTYLILTRINPPYLPGDQKYKELSTFVCRQRLLRKRGHPQTRGHLSWQEYSLKNSCRSMRFAPQNQTSTCEDKVSIKRPARDACLCMGDLQAPPAPHFVFLITL